MVLLRILHLDQMDHSILEEDKIHVSPSHSVIVTLHKHQ